jgi:hypothetical protein
MKRLKYIAIGFLIGIIGMMVALILDLTVLVGYVIAVFLCPVYLWLENAIEKKSKQNITH